MFGVICLVIHHVLMFFLVWSFAMSISVDPARVPEWYARLEMERQGMHVPAQTMKENDEEYKQLADDAIGGSIDLIGLSGCTRLTIVVTNSAWAAHVIHASVVELPTKPKLSMWPKSESTLPVQQTASVEPHGHQ